MCSSRQRTPDSIWLHSFGAGRTCDNAYLLTSSPSVLRRDKPTALARLLAVVAERWMRPHRTPPLLVNDDQPFAGVGADDLPVHLPLNVQINKPRA